MATSILTILIYPVMLIVFNIDMNLENQTKGHLAEWCYRFSARHHHDANWGLDGKGQEGNKKRHFISEVNQ